MDTIKAGMRVVIETTNGGRTYGTLTSDYVPTYPCFFTHVDGHAVTIAGDRVRDVRPLPRGGSYDAVFNSLCRRIALVRPDLLATYGLDAVMAAVEDKASQFESDTLQEVGSSDVSCWLADVEAMLKRGAA
jgi:hypothetical protein